MESHLSGSPYLACSRQNYKRKRDPISSGSSRSQSPWTSDRPDFSSNNVLSPNNLHFNLPSFRFPGNNIDLRRPVMSQPTRDIIDLTEGSNSPPGTRTLPNPDTDPTFTSQRANRPPRFPRDIIDVDDPESLSTLPTNTARDASPDIELLYSRTIPQGTRPQTRPQGIFGYVPTATRVDGSSADAIQNRRPSASNHSQSVRDAWTEARNQMRRDHSMNMMVGQQQPRITHQGRHLSLSQGFQDRQEGVLFMGVQPNLTLPGNLDFIAQGFPMGDIGRVHPAPPTYDAPPSPRTGFTRSPKEDNVLVCPNCDEELGMGSDDTKRQVWVVKQCGHVYCGECTKNRARGKGKAPRAGRTKHFTKCVVDGCVGKSLTHAKSMFQVYL